MTQTLLLTKIEAAKTALGDAEGELRKLVGEAAVASRPEKVEVSEVIRAAFVRLRVATAQLVDLDRLLALSELEEARAAIGDAEKDLARVFDEMAVASRAEKTWVPEVVEEALANLNAAKRRLIDLETSIQTDED